MALRQIPYPVLAASAGAVAALGFAPWHLWPLTLVALAGLLWLVDRASGWRGAAARGWWFGLGHFVVGLGWIATAFTYQAKMPPWLGWVAVVGLSMFLSLYPALAMGLARRLARGRPSLALGLAATWMLAEWLRGWVFTGFPWDPLGAASLPLHGLSQLAAVVGAFGLSGLMLLAAGGIWLVAAPPTRRWGVAMLTLVVLADGAGWAMRGAAKSAPGAPVALIQPNIPERDHYDEAVEVADRDRYVAMTRQALAPSPGQGIAPPSLVIWPEGAVEAFPEEDPALARYLTSGLRPGDLLLFGGVSPVRDAAGRFVTVANSLFVMAPGGRILARYDKAHLVPLGEYLPLRGLADVIGLSKVTPGDSDFARGPGPRTLALPGFPDAGAIICYEVIFAHEVVDPARRPAFVINVSNDAWYGPSGPPQHLDQARLRAIEEGLPIVRSTPTGVSAIIDGEGQVLASQPLGRAGIVSGRVPPPLPPTLFARFGHWPTLLFGLLLGVAALWAGRTRRGDI